MADLRRLSGVRANLQEMRATFGQRAIDAKAEPQAVSRVMRHKTTATTERYYARIRPRTAMDEVRAKLNALVQVR